MRNRVVVAALNGVEPVAKEDVEAVVNQDIERFNEYFKSLGNDSLTRYEVAAIKTYLAFKLLVEPKDEQVAALQTTV